MLDSPHQEFKITMINTLRALVNKRQHSGTDGQCKQMEILRKTQKEMPEIKNTTTEMKNAFDELSRLVTFAERISQLEGN